MLIISPIGLYGSGERTYRHKEAWMQRSKGRSRAAVTMTIRQREFERIVGQDKSPGARPDLEDFATVERLERALELLHEVEHSLLRSQETRRLQGRMLRAPVTVLRQPAAR
jgi:hypothetical protein